MKLKTWLMVLTFIICSLVSFQPVQASTTVPSFIANTPSLQFNGSTYIQLPSNVSQFNNLTGSNSVSEQMWVNISYYNFWNAILSLGTGDDELLFSTNYIYSDGKPTVLNYDETYGVSAVTTSNQVLTLNNWYNLAFTQAANGVTTIYLNGVVVATGTGVVLPTQILYNNSIGAPSSLAPSEYFYGEIKDVSIWNTVLSQSQVQYNMENQLTGSEQHLVACYPLNNQLQGALDISPNHLNGTIEGPTNWIGSPASPLLYQSISQDIDTLSWAAGSYTQVNIFRNNILLATLAGTSTNYQDTVTASGSYDYYILVVNPSGQAASNIVTFYYNPTSTQQLTAYTSDNQLSLSWKPTSSATGYNIIDNNKTIESLPSTTTSYLLELSQPNNNKIYIQSITATGYSASNIIDVDNMLPSKSPDFTFIAYNANNTGFISYLDGVFSKCIDNNSQNIILYPSNVTICQSAS